MMNSGAIDVTVIGVVRSAKINRSSVKKAFPLYKKCFWVVNETTGRFEFFKNDQAPQAKGFFNASQVKGVSFSGDKQNKFFDLCVQLKGGLERRFRMSSREERDRFYDIITAVVEKHSTQSQTQGMIAVVHRHLAEATASSPFSIDVDLELLADGPNEVMQYSVEAVDVGIEFAKSVAKSFLSSSSGKGDESVPFRSVKLVLQLISRGTAGGNNVSFDSHPHQGNELQQIPPFVNAGGTRYDPASRQLILTILLLQDQNTGDVQFGHVSLASVVRMLQSNVWRNPKIEGWLSEDPQMKRQRARIVELIRGGGGHSDDGTLSSPAASTTEALSVVEFGVTMQWGHNTEALGEAELLAYLKAHVSHTLLTDVHDAIQTLVKEFPESEPIAPSNIQLPSARRCFQRYLEGVGVRLELRPMERNQPPQLDVIHSTGADKSLNQASIIFSKLKQISGRSQHPAAVGGSSTAGHHLSPQPTAPGITRLDSFHSRSVHDQLRDIVVHARLAHACNECDKILTSIIGTRDGCFVNWESMFSSLATLMEHPGALEHSALPRIALRFLDRYAPRLLRLNHSLSAAAASSTVGSTGASLRGLQRGGSPPQPAGSFLEKIFLPCVSSVAVDFVICRFSADPSHHSVSCASIPAPSIRSGILCDVVALFHLTKLTSDAVEREVEMAPQVLIGEAPPSKSTTTAAVSPKSAGGTVMVPLAAVAVPTTTTVAFVYAAPSLSPWIKGYFSNPNNIVAAPDRHAAPEADDDESSDGDPLDNAFDFGEMVANERKVETRILNLHHVVNIVYDAQDGVDVQLKVGSAVIRAGIDALAYVFPEGVISKHIIIKIFTTNMIRLRELYCEQLRVQRQRRMKVAAPSQSISPDGRLGRGVNPVPPTQHTRDVEGQQQGSSSEALQEGLPEVIPWSFAVAMLRRFCEYHETEGLIEQALDEVASLREHGSWSWDIGRVPSLSMKRSTEENTASRSISPPSMDSTRNKPSRTFDFESVAVVALCCLLPQEARLAMNSRRDILWLGLENTGKTLLINSVHGVSQPTHPTIGLTENVIAYKEWVFGCKELGGRSDFRKNWKQYMARVEAVHAIVFVVDASRPSVFVEAKEYLDGVAKWKAFARLPVLVVFNNYRGRDKKLAAPEELYRTFGLANLSGGHEVQYCCCDVTVVHSANRELHPDVAEGLNWICDILRQGSTSNPPATPKRTD